MLALNIDSSEKFQIQTQTLVGRSIAVLGITGSGQCLEENEPVFLADGRVAPARSLIGMTVEVVGITGTRTMQQTPVLASFADNGVHPTVEIELDNGVILRRTEEHQLWAADINAKQHVGLYNRWGKRALRTRPFNARWVQAKDIKVTGTRPLFGGQVLLCPTCLHQAGTIPRSDHEVTLCSVLLAEGGLTGKAVRFTSASHVVVEAMACAVAEYGCEIVPIPMMGRGSVINYRICGIERNSHVANKVSELMREWGLYGCSALHKRITQWVFQLPTEQIALFLRFFIDCDGWFDASDRRQPAVNVSLANEILVRQIGQLALRLGIAGSYFYKSNDKAGAWMWSSPMVDAWHNSVGLTLKAEKLARAVQIKTQLDREAKTDWNAWRQARPSPTQTFADCPDGYEWRKVMAVRFSEAPTVSIEVLHENHVFVGYAVEHNEHTESLRRGCAFPRLSQ